MVSTRIKIGYTSEFYLNLNLKKSSRLKRSERACKPRTEINFTERRHSGISTSASYLKKTGGISEMHDRRSCRQRFKALLRYDARESMLITASFSLIFLRGFLDVRNYVSLVLTICAARHFKGYSFVFLAVSIRKFIL